MDAMSKNNETFTPQSRTLEANQLRPYHRPKLMCYGGLSELVQSMATPGGSDGGTMADMTKVS